jgi:predicted dehydrogenase
MVDVSAQALASAKNELSETHGSDKLMFLLAEEFPLHKTKIDVGIIASTAKGRIDLCKALISKGAKNLLLEKPLGQSLAEVNELIAFFDQHPEVNAFVNLSRRLFEPYIKLHHDLAHLPQLAGEKTMSINTGTIGIGTNGIHYLDLLFFLYDADHAEIAACEIDPDPIPSGRGPQYRDYGGWAVIKFYSSKIYVGKAVLSIAANSTVFGGWEIIAPHGRIMISEREQKRTDIFRRADSILGVHRYGAEYLDPAEYPMPYPALGDITCKWIESIGQNSSQLPRIKESLKVHVLLFEWLSHAEGSNNVFPIT